MVIEVGVKALIKNKAHEYLFIERTEELLDGSGIKWDVPGGLVHLGETLVDALYREVKQETNFEIIGEPKLLGAQDIILPKVDLHIIRLTYSIDVKGELSLGEEHNAHTWATLEQSKNLNVDNLLRKTLTNLENRKIIN